MKKIILPAIITLTFSILANAVEIDTCKKETVRLMDTKMGKAILCKIANFGKGNTLAFYILNKVYKIELIDYSTYYAIALYSTGSSTKSLMIESFKNINEALKWMDNILNK